MLETGDRMAPTGRTVYSTIRRALHDISDPEQPEELEEHLRKFLPEPNSQIRKRYGDYRNAVRKATRDENLLQKRLNAPIVEVKRWVLARQRPKLAEDIAALERPSFGYGIPVPGDASTSGMVFTFGERTATQQQHGFHDAYTGACETYIHQQINHMVTNSTSRSWVRDYDEPPFDAMAARIANALTGIEYLQRLSRLGMQRMTVLSLSPFSQAFFELTEPPR